MRHVPRRLQQVKQWLCFMRQRVSAGLVAVLAVGALSGCQMAGMVALDATNLLALFGDYERTADLAYGPLPRQKLDVYSPHVEQDDLSPVLIFFYGGNWSQGYPGKDMYRFVADALTSRDFVAVIPNYRRYPDVRFPAFVEDGAAAVVWTREHIAEYGGDPRRIFLMGHSAGGHIAAMIALDDHYLLDAGGQPSWIRGLIGMAGVYSFVPVPGDGPPIEALFGPPARYALAEPINYVQGDEPPMLLLTGGEDERVPRVCTQRLADRVAHAGGQVQTTTYAHLDHIMLIGSLANPVRWSTPVLDDIARFVHKVDDQINPRPPKVDLATLARTDVTDDHDQ